MLLSPPILLARSTVLYCTMGPDKLVLTPIGDIWLFWSVSHCTMSPPDVLSGSDDIVRLVKEIANALLTNTKKVNKMAGISIFLFILPPRFLPNST